MKPIGINELLMLVSEPRVAKQPKGYLTADEIAVKWNMSPCHASGVLLGLFKSKKIDRLKFGKRYIYGPFKNA